MKQLIYVLFIALTSVPAFALQIPDCWDSTKKFSSEGSYLLRLDPKLPKEDAQAKFSEIRKSLQEVKEIGVLYSEESHALVNVMIIHPKWDLLKKERKEKIKQFETIRDAIGEQAAKYSAYSVRCESSFLELMPKSSYATCVIQETRGKTRETYEVALPDLNIKECGNKDCYFDSKTFVFKLTPSKKLYVSADTKGGVDLKIDDTDWRPKSSSVRSSGDSGVVSISLNVSADESSDGEEWSAWAFCSAH